MFEPNKQAQGVINKIFFLIFRVLINNRERIRFLNQPDIWILLISLQLIGLCHHGIAIILLLLTHDHLPVLDPLIITEDLKQVSAFFNIV